MTKCLSVHGEHKLTHIVFWGSKKYSAVGKEIRNLKTQHVSINDTPT